MIGQTVSHYKILEKLGEGGMAAVYKAEDTRLRRPVALKFLPSEMTRDESAKKQFIIEAQAASALDHPNIAVVHDISETEDGRSYICMAYYSGQTLKKKVEAGPLEIEEALRIAQQVASALESAHEAGIVHQDIKPGNVILTDRGEAKIVDFGIAKLAGQTRGARTGMFAGTAGYMSPEQVQGIQTDQRSDLFSFGVMLYELVTGKRPFIGEHESALFYSIVNVTPPEPSSLRGTIPLELDRIILRLLEKDREKRYQSAAELRADFALLARSLNDKQSTRAQRWIIKHWRIVSAAALIVCILLAVPLVREMFTPTPEQPLEQLAVLPFTTVGTDPADKAFCDGLMEVITSKLSELKEFQRSIAVVPAVEIRSRKIVSASEARDVFKVTLAISGSIQRIGDKVRLTISLIDAKKLRQKNSLVIDDNLTNVASFQDGVVLKLSRFLDVQLEPRTIRLLAADTTIPPNAYALYLQARGYQQQESTGYASDTAIALFQRAIAEDPLYVDAYHGLATVYEGLRQYNPAESTYIQAIEARPESWVARNNLGVFYTRRGRFEEALREFQRVIDLAPDNVRGYNNLGGIFLYLGRAPEARAMFDHSLHIMPNPAAYANLGTLLFFYEGRYAEAADMYEKAMQFDDRDYEVWGSLASAYYWEPSLHKKAHRAYRRAAELADNIRILDPRDARVISRLADFDAMLGEHEKARGLIGQALQLSPTDPDVLARAAEIYEFLGDRERALQLIGDAFRNGYAPALIEGTPALKELRGDNRFGKIFNEVHQGGRQ